MSAPGHQRSPLGAMVLGGATTVVGLLPVFLTGAMAVQLTEDLAFGLAGLGVAVALYRATSAATSVHLGRLADRIGATWSVRLAAGCAALAALGIATTATSWVTLAAWLMIGSCANSLGQPAANRLLINVVQPERLGTAFGIKQSAPPTASMLAGFSVPALALTLGWRWAFALAALLAVAVFVGAGRRPPMGSRARRSGGGRSHLADRRTVLVLAGAFGLGTTASSTVPVFYVDAAVRAGSSPQLAGTLLAAASVLAIGTRLVAGIACDRIAAGHLRLCAGLLATGSFGLVLLAVGTPAAMSAGVLVALAGAWGFNGVFWYALVRAYPDAPGAITGALAPGGLVGSTVGPIVFGLLAERVAYPAAWAFAGVAAVLAAAAMIFGARRLHQPAPPAAA